MSEPTPIKDVIKEKNVESLKSNSKGKGKGGARKGAGRPRGRLDQKTLDQLAEKRRIDQRILRHLDRLVNAQMQLATGEQVLMVVITEGEGKNRRRYHEQVSDIETIKQYLDYEEGINDAESPNDSEHYYYLSKRPANNQALDSLINRALGKSPDKLEVTGGLFDGRSKLIRFEVVGDDDDTDEEQPEPEPESKPADEPGGPDTGHLVEQETEAGPEPAERPADS